MTLEQKKILGEQHAASNKRNNKNGGHQGGDENSI
jgi:hypothetical protein